MANTSDLVIDTLTEWGVEVVFGLPGDGINGLMESLRKRSDDIRFMQVRHEESAAFMACGYAKYTGRLGVCLATSGPGAIHLLNGLYDAKLDGQPVLAITGMPFHDLIGTGTQQDVETDKLFTDVAVYNQRVMGPAHVENVLNAACRTALAYHGVAHVGIPVDIQEEDVGERRSERNVPGKKFQAYATGASKPSEENLAAAAELLNKAERPAILAGRGALGATAELERVAERMGAPVVKALLGKAAVPDDSYYSTGQLGLLGTLPSQEVMESCDALLMVGTSFPYSEFLPEPGQAKVVQVDLDPARIGLRYPVDVGLAGDASTTLDLLAPLLEKRTERDFLEETRQKVVDWNEQISSRSDRDDYPMKPQVVAKLLGERLSDTSIVSADSGTITTWWARYIPVKRGQMHSVSGTLASMACALPYAIAAQTAYPDRQCVAFCGDGGLSMLMAELATCAKYELPVKVFVIKNNTLGQIKWEQMVFLGNPEYGCELQPIDFAAVADACGIRGLKVDRAEDCAGVIDEALAHRGPVLVEATVDPFEPPMPPKTTMEQATNMAKSLARGEPNRERIAMTLISNKVRELI